MIGVIERTGFAAAAEALRPLKKDMDDLIEAFDSKTELEKKQKKEEWIKKVGEIYALV
jgi:predicted nucleotide-binding protein (sugar kinase/HSP70/actin superfamily)